MANRKAAIGITTIAAALCVVVPFVNQREGERLQAYQDVVGVWTICRGETVGVSKGDLLTREQCNTLSQSRIGMFMLQIVPMIQVALTPNTLAAHTSFAYNIGVDGYRGSKTLKLTNAGQISAGCQAMANWYTAGGKDCRDRRNNCYGLITRRNDEIALCLAGIK